MDWTERVPSLVVMGELDTMWGRLESKIESRGGSVETQIEPFGKLDEEARTMLLQEAMQDLFVKYQIDLKT